MFPDVQGKAKAELDAVVGSERLPTFEDREKLPYVNALALEVLRWHTVAPTGMFRPIDLRHLLMCAPCKSCGPSEHCGRYARQIFHSQRHACIGQPMVSLP